MKACRSVQAGLFWGGVILLGSPALAATQERVLCSPERAIDQDEKREDADPLSHERLVVLATESQQALRWLQMSRGALVRSLGAAVPRSAEGPLQSLQKNIDQAAQTAEEAVAARSDDEALRFKVAAMTAQVEMARSALTRLKLGLQGIELSSESQNSMRSLEEGLDALRKALQVPGANAVPAR